jgi:transposase
MSSRQATNSYVVDVIFANVQVISCPLQILLQRLILYLFNLGKRSIRFNLRYKHESTMGYTLPRIYLTQGGTLVSSQTVSIEERLLHLEGHYTDRVVAFRRRLAELGPDRVLILLLDIGKNVHWVTARTAADRELLPPQRLPTTRDGLTRFLRVADALMAELTPALVILGHEPTGVYHEPWARALMGYYAANLAGQSSPLLEYLFFNPYQVKLARLQTHLRHRKTDPRDLAAMFDLTIRGLGYPAFLPTGTELLVRQEIGFIRAQSRLLGRLERQLRPQLDRLWPGAVVNIKQFRKAHPALPEPTPIIQTRPLERQRIRILLAHCPNPHHLKAMSDQQILTLFREHMGRAGPALLRTLRTWVHNAPLLPHDVSTPLANQLQLLFQQYLVTETLIQEGCGRLIPLLPATPARHLPDIPGLGEMDAAAYLAGIGSISRFDRAAQVWSFAGYDPIADGSGDSPDRVGHLSKRGDPAFRGALYQMGYRTAQNYAPVGLTFLDAFDRGKSEVEATIHAAHKVNRICFHLMQNDEPFEYRSSPRLDQEKERRWRLFKAEKKHRGTRRKRGKRRR